MYVTDRTGNEMAIERAYLSLPIDLLPRNVEKLERDNANVSSVDTKGQISGISQFLREIV